MSDGLLGEFEVVAIPLEADAIASPLRGCDRGGVAVVYPVGEGGAAVEDGFVSGFGLFFVGERRWFIGAWIVERTAFYRTS